MNRAGRKNLDNPVRCAPPPFFVDFFRIADNDDIRLNDRSRFIIGFTWFRKSYVERRNKNLAFLVFKEIINSDEKTAYDPLMLRRRGRDLRRAEAAVASLQADIPPLEESLLHARNAIATIAGQFPGAFTGLLKHEQPIPAYAGSIQQAAPLDVIFMRPDVQQAETELVRAVMQIGVAEAEWRPAFQIGQQLSLSGVGTSGEPTVGLFVAGLNALIQHVVTDGGAREASVDIAKARADQALARYHQTLLLAVEDVEISLAALQASIDRQVPLEKAVEASARSAFQAEVLYRQGLASFLDVVDAQRVLANAQQRLARTKTNYAVEIANLFRVIGAEIHSAPPQ